MQQTLSLRRLLSLEVYGKYFKSMAQYFRKHVEITKAVMNIFGMCISESSSVNDLRVLFFLRRDIPE